jgi:hypothetical protein
MRTHTFLSRFPHVVWSDSPARPIPVNVVLLRIIQQCPFGGAWDLALDDTVADTQFRVHQIPSLCPSAVDKLHKGMPTRAIARIFDPLTNGDAIWKGRREHALLKTITKNIQNRVSMNYTEKLYYSGQPRGIAVAEQWVDPFVSHRKSSPFEAISRCQENPRLGIPRSLLHTVAKCIRQCLPSCCIELLFNFHEVGILASEDRVRRKVTVAVSIELFWNKIVFQNK